MKRFKFKIAGSKDECVIMVDDFDAGRFRTEVWKAVINKGLLEMSRNYNGRRLMLGRVLLGINEPWVCVTHKNGDNKDYRRNNLMAITWAAHMKEMNILSPKTGRPKKIKEQPTDSPLRP